jgi:hypothetical protein
VGQGVTERGWVGERLRVANGALHSEPRLVGVTPEPENPRQHDASCDLLIEPEPDERRASTRIDLGAHHPLDVSPRVRLIAQVMIRRSHHPIRDRQGGRVGILQHEGVKSLAHGEGGAVLASIRVVNPKLPQRPQLVFGVAERFGEAESRGTGPPGRGNCTFGKQQRRAERGLQLHLAADIDWHPTCQRSEHLFDAATAFVYHWQLQPERDRCDG